MALALREPQRSPRFEGSQLHMEHTPLAEASGNSLDRSPTSAFDGHFRPPNSQLKIG